MSIDKINISGAYTAVAILILAILIFVFRLLKGPKIEYWAGILFMLTAFPLIYLLITANRFNRPGIYYIQIIIMLGFIIMELFLDYILKIDFRSIKWATIVYVMFFFAGTGGMIGIASRAGKGWTVLSVILYLIMTAMAFIQRIITGM